MTTTTRKWDWRCPRDGCDYAQLNRPNKPILMDLAWEHLRRVHGVRLRWDSPKLVLTRAGGVRL